MKPVTASMAMKRQQVLSDIARGYSDMVIHQKTGYSKVTISKYRKELRLNKSLFIFNGTGRPAKKSIEVLLRIHSITTANPRMSNDELVNLLKVTQVGTFSREFVRQCRKETGFYFSPPIRTFALTDAQIAARLSFANEHLQNQTDWTRGLFVDE